MYYIFDPKKQVWKGDFLQAVFLGNMLDYEPEWRLAEPLIKPSPPNFSFEIDGAGPMPDNYWTGTALSVYSTLLISKLREAGIRFETFPTTFLDQETGQPLLLDYEVFHLLEIYPCLDRERSIIVPLNSASEIHKLVLTPSCQEAHHLFFRIKEKRYLIVIHEDLKTSFETAGITGCQYTPVEEFNTRLQVRFSSD